MSTLQRAIEIAVEAHAGQSSRDGLPYVLHPLRLMLQMESDEARMAAVLHDVVEDNPAWTLARLQGEGFSAAVLQAVDDLTRRDAESYEAFVERAIQRPLGRAVKQADLRDNMNIERLPELRGRDLERLERYHAAWKRIAALEGQTPAAGPAA